MSARPIAGGWRGPMRPRPERRRTGATRPAVRAKPKAAPTRRVVPWSACSARMLCAAWPERSNRSRAMKIASPTYASTSERMPVYSSPSRARMAEFSPEAFRRHDESPDPLFYLQPRFVTHIDDAAVEAVTQLYRDTFPPGGAILDLMSSWVSHLPPEVAFARVVGVGLNRRELAANPRL